jgi:AraC-like DNA-binding protein
MEAHTWTSQNVLDTFWRYYFNFRDGAEIQLDSETIVLRDRTPYFVPAGVRFGCDNRQPVEHFFIHFDVLGWAGHQLRELFPAPVELPVHDMLQFSVERLANDVAPQAEPGIISQCRLKSLLWESFALHFETLPESRRAVAEQATAAQAAVWPALRHIEDHLGAKLSNAELARLCHWSEDYFIRRFRECVGQSPAQYILERRVARASQQLLFSSSSIESIAESCGFANRFYFSRVFAQHIGVAPAAYRKLSRL